MSISVRTNSPAETIELGRKIGQALGGNEVIALYGNLGSGKTHFVKGIAIGAGTDESDMVNSPTFVLVNEYPARRPIGCIYHIDAYRFDEPEDICQTGFDDMIGSGAAVLIEWADKVEDMLAGIDCIRIKFGYVDELSREITFDDQGEKLLQQKG